MFSRWRPCYGPCYDAKYLDSFIRVDKHDTFNSCLDLPSHSSCFDMPELPVVSYGLFAIHDTGAPPGKVEYPTLVMLHGFTWHSGAFWVF